MSVAAARAASEELPQQSVLHLWAEVSVAKEANPMQWQEELELILGCLVGGLAGPYLGLLGWLVLWGKKQ